MRQTRIRKNRGSLADQRRSEGFEVFRIDPRDPLLVRAKELRQRTDKVDRPLALASPVQIVANQPLVQKTVTEMLNERAS